MVYNLTKEGFEKIQKRLAFLKNEKMPQVVIELQQAISYGDERENAEWDEMKLVYQQTLMEINDLEAILKDVLILNSSNSTQIGIGSKVRIKNFENQEEKEIHIVEDIEIDPSNGKISPNSPLGKALFGKQIGDIIKLDLANKKYEVLEIK